MMKTFTLYIFSLFLLIVVLSCTQNSTITEPIFSDGGKLASAVPITSHQLSLLSGVYTVIDGNEQFGKMVVVKATNTTLSLFTGKNAALFVLRTGRIDSSIYLEGYWRYTQGEETGLAQFEIDANAGGKNILLEKNLSSSFILRGKIGNGSLLPSSTITLQYNRPLNTSLPFWIIAHRGGGRNSDRLPDSENSLGIIQRAESFGANAVEIDVRLTKDGIPILFHDDNFSPRLVNGEYCIGPVSNYTFAHIRTLCTLKNGERIPTLKEALDVILTKTNLSLVWLDLKSAEALAVAAPMQQEYKQKAALQGRTLEIFLGLPSDELVDAYKKQNLVSSADALCELELSDVRNTNARVWAPRWTLGPLKNEVEQMHKEGRRVFVWTLDQPEFIQTFLNDGKPDGILTNYPALVAYEYFISH